MNTQTEIDNAPHEVISGDLSGTYPSPPKVGHWRGWIEHDGGIAFVGEDNAGLWWRERDKLGGVVGDPVAFKRSKAGDQ